MIPRCFFKGQAEEDGPAVGASEEGRPKDESENGAREQHADRHAHPVPYIRLIVIRGLASPRTLLDAEKEGAAALSRAASALCSP